MRLPSLFNCSNDMALAANVRQYLPPKRIQQMEEDLKDLAQYWDEGPWGWSLCTKQRYRKMGIPEEELPSDEWLGEVRRLSSREFACNYIKEMLGTLNDERLVGHEMQFCTALPAPATTAPAIYKSPWSSSGRGVFTSQGLSQELIDKRLQGFLNTQGGFVADRFYDKELDYAMEFYVHRDHTVEFLGYSIFHAEENGAYGYNLVDDQHALMSHISSVRDLNNRLIEYHMSHLGQTAYHGPVGIDMLLLKSGPDQVVNGKSQNTKRIHPCIEINLRMNMGILALLLYKRYGSKANIQLTPPRPQGFEAKIEDGKLVIKVSR